MSILVELGLYFSLLWSRWADEDGWAETKPRIEPFFPAAVRWFLPGVIRKKVIEQELSKAQASK